MKTRSVLMPTCTECSRIFNLLDLGDADEWYGGHDCEDN